MSDDRATLKFVATVFVIGAIVWYARHLITAVFSFVLSTASALVCLVCIVLLVYTLWHHFASRDFSNNSLSSVIKRWSAWLKSQTTARPRRLRSGALDNTDESEFVEPAAGARPNRIIGLRTSRTTDEREFSDDDYLDEASSQGFGVRQVEYYDDDNLILEPAMDPLIEHVLRSPQLAKILRSHRAKVAASDVRNVLSLLLEHDDWTTIDSIASDAQMPSPKAVEVLKILGEALNRENPEIVVMNRTAGQVRMSRKSLSDIYPNVE